MNLPTEFYQIMKVKPFFMILISAFYIDIFFILLEHYEKREREALILDFFFEKSPFEGLD